MNPVMIHRKQVEGGEVFSAPQNVTFGYQEHRHAFSVWYKSGDEVDTAYVILGTGHEFSDRRFSVFKLRASFVMPDGFHVFHLIECIP